MGANEWCLVRWTEGECARRLAERGERNWTDPRDPVTGLAFCGPLSDISGDVKGLGLRLGFPGGKVGKLVLFDSKEEATRCVEDDGSRLGIDTPTPVSALVFSVRHYSHYDGKSVETDAASYAQARGLYLETLAEHEGDNYAKISIECRPDHAKLGENRPTKEQADAINTRAREMDEKRKRSSREAAERDRLPGPGENACGFIEAWVGACKNSAGPSGRCHRHDKKCVSCGAPATRSCEHTGQFVCGEPLCDGCEHGTPPPFSMFQMGGGHQRRAETAP